MRIPQAFAFAALLGAASSGGRAARAGEPTVITIDHDDIDITADVVVKPGVYHVEDKNGDGVLRIKADGVKVVLTGVTLDGAPPAALQDAFEGVGVAVAGRKGVSIEGGAVRGFRVGVRGASSPSLTLNAIDASGCRAMRLKSTPEREDESDWLWPHENDEGQWEKNYGAGISVTDSRDLRVVSCSAHHGQNGLLLTRCGPATVSLCDFSFNSGWGIALYRSSECAVFRNACDWCVRGYSHGVYARGQDSAGILVFEQCSRNQFDGNHATHCGDGFFLYAGNDTLKRSGRGGSNFNHVMFNDFSDAVANGIEATFSEGNVFLGNRLNRCDHAVWAGYSYRTKIGLNVAQDCANGISVEHGHENRIEANVLTRCATGIHLWWDPDPDLTGGVYGKAQDTSSSKNVVIDNWIVGGEVALRLASDTDSHVEHNRIDGAVLALATEGTTAGLTFSGNRVAGAGDPSEAGAIVQCDSDLPLDLAANWWWPGGAAAVPMLTGRQKVNVAASLDVEPKIARPLIETIFGGKTLDEAIPEVPPLGRQHMIIGEWGPLDPRVPAVFPAKQTAAGAAHLHVLGASAPFTVEKVTDGFVAEPMSGTTPAAVTIRRKDAGAGPSLAAFGVTVRIGDKTLSTSGSILSMKWKVRFFGWKKDPREDAAAWKALVEGPALDTMDLDGLDFHWGSAAPSPKVPADRFGTVAETALTLPPGPYLIRTTSDDGIRVIVDGKTIFEDWTHHAPKDDSIPITLTEGSHAIRVEHFELDGWAALRCSLEPVVDHR